MELSLLFVYLVANFFKFNVDYLYFYVLGGLLGPRMVRVSGTAETECASGKPSV